MTQWRRERQSQERDYENDLKDNREQRKQNKLEYESTKRGSFKKGRPSRTPPNWPSGPLVQARQNLDREKMSDLRSIVIQGFRWANYRKGPQKFRWEGGQGMGGGGSKVSGRRKKTQDEKKKSARNVKLGGGGNFGRELVGELCREKCTKLSHEKKPKKRKIPNTGKKRDLKRQGGGFPKAGGKGNAGKKTGNRSRYKVFAGGTTKREKNAWDAVFSKTRGLRGGGLKRGKGKAELERKKDMQVVFRKLKDA